MVSIVSWDSSKYCSTISNRILINKVLKSAVANAEHNLSLSKESLYITKICIDQGPSLKRFKPRAKGRADHMVHRTSHITVVVGDREEE